jgi:hypothetical protein
MARCKVYPSSIIIIDLVNLTIPRSSMQPQHSARYQIQGSEGLLAAAADAAWRNLKSCAATFLTKYGGDEAKFFEYW